jgi:hypothetical protein
MLKFWMKVFNDHPRRGDILIAVTMAARVNVVVASFMQPTAVNQRTPNAS